jgi:TPR repeat protein
MYRLGLGMERDVKKAFPRYQKAATQGYKHAKARLEELARRSVSFFFSSVARNTPACASHAEQLAGATTALGSVETE